ncbi:MAG: sugar transferase [Syntrophobacteraceae bacterium]|jgi:lipopolysaccharide/colanic/teichoic acid biosynthesis glycosyltransferase/NDP-sugar pyrophosphorylase family protein|nr:sugar transferase [Syntrophobacteraceae bacterium]
MPQTAVILSHGPTLLNDLKVSPLPKVLLPVGGRTLLEYQGALMASVGVKQVLVCLQGEDGLLGRRIEDLLSPFPFRTRCLVQKEQLGTGGALKLLTPWIDDRFWMLSGDLFLFGDLAEMLYHHRESSSCATAGVVRVEESGWEMERVETGPRQGIRRIHRVHPAHDRRSKLRPVGLYLFERVVLDHIRPDGYFDLKEQLFEDLHRKGLPGLAWELCGYSKNLRSLDKYFELQEDLLLKRAGLSGIDQWLPPPAVEMVETVAPRATVIEPVSLGENCSIQDGAIVVGPATIGRNCVVQKNAVVAESILFDGSTVEESAYVRKCLLGDGTRVERDRRLHDFILLRDQDSSTQRGWPLPWSFYGSPSPGFQCVARMRCGRNHLKADYLHAKRLLDVVTSLLALVFCAPLMVLIALAIKLDTPGGIIFRQKRCGRDGREFTMYKFRSMVVEAEALKRELITQNEVDGPMFKITSDPRTTRVGVFLRTTNLDELPQFWNVLRGDMTLVGPRPLSWDEMRYNPPWRDARLLVKPGLIGMWQVESHEKTSFADWVVLDTYYVNHCSMWLDIKIIFRAFFLILGSVLKGVFRLIPWRGGRHASQQV